MKIPINDIKINSGRRETEQEGINDLARSISEIGLLNPITVNQNHTLIAGMHRLEAVKLLGWAEIECTVCGLDGLQAELAEIDENVVRNELSVMEYGKLLIRRKEIYESLHPETKAGISQAAGMNRAIGNNVSDKMSSTSKSFAQDTAEKLGVSPRTVERIVKVMNNLNPEAKEILRGADFKVTQSALTKISRLESDQQKEAADLLVRRVIKSVDEYHPAEKSEPPERKIGNYTPDIFFLEYSSLIRDFRQKLAHYSDAGFDSVIANISPEQAARLKDITDACRDEMIDCINRIKANANT